MTFLYDISLSTYQLIAKLISPFSTKAKFWSEGRRSIFARIKSALQDEKREIAWFHAASLGEFEQGRPVIELFREKNPDYAIFLTFFSPSGYEVRKNYEGADYIFYLPIDTHSNAAKFMSLVKPKIAVFIKYEFWGNYLSQLNNKSVKTYVVSAIFREKQLFFKSYGRAYRKVLTNFSHLFVQDDNSKNLLANIGVKNVTVCGDTRFDRVYSIATAAEPIEIFEKFASKGRKIFISGSSWERDDQITLELIKKFDNLKFIIAPHELGEQKIANLQKDISAIGRRVVRYTQIDENEIDNAADSDVIIVDTIGILSKIYRYGSYAFIGGGFGAGIHNTLEAATFGLPLIFGQNYKRFAEAVTLTNLGVAQPINSDSDAIVWLKNLESNGQEYATLSAKCTDFVKSNVGACEKIINHPLI